MSDINTWWDTLVSDYERYNPAHKVEGLLGQGNSAAVFKLLRPEGVAALKIYKPQFLEGPNEAAERFRLSLHERLKNHGCPSLVTIYDIGDLPQSAYITMEFVPWPALDSVLGAIPTNAVPQLISDVAHAVQWLERNSLVHRDIKPANILVSPDFSAAKVVDFGVIRTTDETAPDLTDHGHRRPFVATAQYSSPEYLFRLIEPSDELWRGLSIYQVGAVLHDMLERRPLFHEEVLADNRYVLAMAVLKRTPSFYGRDYPVAWGALARRALTKDLDVRLRVASLDHFIKLDVFDSDAARVRLGLGRPTQPGVVESVQRESERKRIQLRKVRDELQEKLSHELRAEGYGRIRWLEREEDSVWLLVQTPGATDGYVSFRIQAIVHDENLQLLRGVSLDGDPPAAVACDQLLWEGGLDQAGAILEAEVVPLVSELLLRALVEASDNLTIERIQKFPTPLLEGA